MVRKIIPLLVFLGMTAPSMSQLVECIWTQYCDHEDGCFYICSDGYYRNGSTRFFKYSCENVNDLYNEMPNCNAIYEKIRRENNERKKRQSENYETYAREEGKRCDLGQAYQMSVCLKLIGQFYIDKVNEFLVNGQNTPLIDKIDFYSGRDSINAYKYSSGNCFDFFSYKDIGKGKGLEISLTDAGTRSCFVFEKNRSSCKKGMKILLKTSFKNGKQDKVADECDFWNDCEKVDGMVLDGVSWNIPGKTNCDAALKERMKDKTLDIRKKFK
ncbi:hypothetical protein [Fibrobacter sp. UWB7]|uniref:hypothetical protein n=1 Tax=Fibrobacter sp. UWB7 TaxID=1896206 RepID=UPI000911CD56|nr:hypothetical protein [Fibrobacter sp. UWB7]SHM08627.1 hypothetical protein SAMN05720467_0528 [Fibrobacter sp. UWB7]